MTPDFPPIEPIRVALHTLGCKLNYAETAQIRQNLEQYGHTIVDMDQAYDAVIINTCTVTENADSECRKIVRRIMRANPHAFVGVTGCYAQLQPEEIASCDGVDAVYGSKEKFRIAELTGHFSKRDTPQIWVSDLSDADFDESSSAEGDSRTRAFLKLQDGCSYNCSFCTIPLARGKSRSLDFGKIESEITRLVAQGFHEIILAGINLGDYGFDGKKLIDVLRLVDRIDLPVRYRLGSVEPNLVTTEIIDLVAESDRFAHHFHIPLQSGSPEILRLMRRRYKASQYQQLIENIRSTIPDCGIGVDVIVGFPGETDELFEESFSFVRELPVSYLHVFTYSERENTPAADFGGRVDVQNRRIRNHRMRILSDLKKRSFVASQRGTMQTMIPESFARSGEELVGYTGNYIRTVCRDAPLFVAGPMRVLLSEQAGELVQAHFVGMPATSHEQRYVSLDSLVISV